MTPSIPIMDRAAPVWRGRPSLQRKLTYLCGTVAAATVAILAAFMLKSQGEAIKDDLAHTADAIVRDLQTPAITAALADDSAVVVEAMKDRLLETRELRYLVLSRHDGRALVVERPLRWSEQTLTGPDWQPVGAVTEGRLTRTALSDQRVFHASLPVTAAGRPWGWLHVGLALEHYEASVRGLWRITALVCGGTFLLAGLASFVCARNLTQPLRAVQQFAQRVAAGTLNTRLNLQSHDEIGDLAESLNTMMTSLSLSQEKLRLSMSEQAALREKEVLLREIHHRVKNNLQMLSSLMRLQSRTVEEERTRAILRESEARIRSMGLIHERLYQSEHLSSIHMPDYLGTLTAELLSMAGGPPEARPRLQVGVAAIPLDIDTALPCGLIVTELVQNSLKYAFPTPEAAAAGQISVSLGREGSGALSLVVMDNGVGIPPGFDPLACRSLGMRLVKMLADQLHGTMSLRSEGGLRVEVVFHESIYRDRL
jgi:two-component sensor histidine kinase